MGPGNKEPSFDIFDREFNNEKVGALIDLQDESVCFKSIPWSEWQVPVSIEEDQRRCTYIQI